jgi:hypothetical protein
MTVLNISSAHSSLGKLERERERTGSQIEEMETETETEEEEGPPHPKMPELMAGMEMEFHLFLSAMMRLFFTADTSSSGSPV